MRRLPNIQSSNVAVLFIIIGLLHIDIHLRELDSAIIQSRLTQINDVQLLGQPADMWKLWQGFSFMMGTCFVIIGVLRLVTIQVTSLKHQLLGAFTMVLLLVIVIISGVLFFAAPQIYGGGVGLLMQTISIALLVKNARNPHLQP
ncbi:MAG: hypothetical protein ACFB15_17290 [Cyclobacteriaceae bacterium]